MSATPQSSTTRSIVPVRTGYHVAADIAIWCLAGVFCLPLFLIGVLRDAAHAAFSGAKQTANAWVTVGVAGIGLWLLLVLASFVLGIVALVAIRRLGTKGLLWKGLIAVVTPILLSSVIISAFTMAREMVTQRARQQQQAPR